MDELRVGLHRFCDQCLALTWSDWVMIVLSTLCLLLFVALLRLRFHARHLERILARQTADIADVAKTSVSVLQDLHADTVAAMRSMHETSVQELRQTVLVTIEACLEQDEEDYPPREDY